MDSEKQYVREIDLKDLIFAILRKWRSMLMVALVLAVLLGGVKAFQVYRSYQDADAQAAKMEDFQQQMDLYTTAKETSEREIENINEDIQTQQKYMDESVLMNMSPYDVCEAKADLFIKTDYQIMPGMLYQNADYTDTILQAYQSALASAALQENVAKEVSLEPQYLKELITVTRGSVKMDDAGFTRFNNLLTIKVRHSEKAKAEEILNSILADIEKLQGQIAEAIGPHTVSVVNKTVGSTVDTELAKKQKESRDQITDLQQSLTEKEDALKELKEPQAPAIGKGTILKTGIKYAVVGAIVGVFVVALCISIMFVMSDKIQSAKDVRRRYNLNLLGTVENADKKNALDLWLAHLEGRRTEIHAEQNHELLATNIENYAGNLRSLLVTGLIKEDKLNNITENLQKKLPGYTLVAGENMLVNANTLRKLPECEGVILVEQAGVSSYSEMTLEIEKVRSMDKMVIGYILYEN